MKSKNTPSVSVVITNYNYGEFLKQAVESALNQTYRSNVVYVIDDASTDNSLEILKEYDNKITIIKHKVNKGIVYARNEALDFVDSKYLMFLDADDWIDSNYLEVLVDAAESRDLDVAYCDAQYFIKEKADMGLHLNPPEYSIERLKNGNYIHMTSLLRVKSISDARFDKGMERITHEDWDFFLNLGLRGLKFGKVEGASLNYRVKPVNRNMHLNDEIGFANLYKYIYEKYEKEVPDQIEYLAYYGFVNKFLRVGEELLEARDTIKKEQDNSEMVQKRLNEVLGSRTYRAGRLLSFPFRFLKRILRKIRSLEYKKTIQSLVLNSNIYNYFDDRLYEKRNKASSKEHYFLKKDGDFNKKSNFAVVLHLYYVNNWQKFFSEKLLKLARNLSFDLYITMPEKNISHIESIRSIFPAANVLVVPNKGRDVLPFIKTAGLLVEMGYKKVLKVHSKKSLHRNHELNTAETGDAWLENTLNALIPENPKIMTKLVDKLKDEKTGMIGASEYLYPLKMYLKNNRRLVERTMHTIGYKLFSGNNISDNIDKLSYFGGTMFWVDLDSIRPVLSISKLNFPSEKAQNDATIAHALERVFCILPQLEGRSVFSVSAKGLSRVESGKSVFPDWYFDDISSGRPKISIVVPVYSDWSSLSKNINSLKKYIGNSEDVSVHYVNDCGPEVDDLEKRILENIAGLTNFFYYRNEKNLGFVKTCNRAALELTSKKDDILLLNSDTKVTKNFVDEMRRVLYSDDNIGAVTSRSNNATIWSIPMTSKFANYRLLSYVFYRLIKRDLPEKYITPTIHGFCVLIRREVINRYGLFDEIYGRGYGEENDFAMRIRANGWNCAVANYSFVFHYESRSFGNEARNEQIRKNEKILVKRYPEYRALVQEYWDSVKEPLK